MQLDEGANSPSAVVTAPDMRGGIPTTTAIDTPTVNATAIRHLRQIVNILDSNDSATKRTHNYTVPLGRKVHPSKVPRTNTQGNLSTFNGMSAQGAQVHMANTHVTEPPMDTSNPFAPLGQNIVGYNIMRDDNSSSDNTSHKISRWNSRLQVRNNGKGKGKGKPFKKGKTRGPNDPYWIIPEFGNALGNARVVLLTMTQFSEPTNPYRVKLPVQLQRSNLPGYVVNTPDPVLIVARKQQGKTTDQDLSAFMMK